MSLSKIILVAVAAIVVLGAVAAGGWWFCIREDAKLATNAPAIPADLKTPAATSASGAASTATTGSSTSGALTFKILSDRSEAAYFADEKLASLPLPSKA